MNLYSVVPDPEPTCRSGKLQIPSGIFSIMLWLAISWVSLFIRATEKLLIRLCDKSRVSRKSRFPGTVDIWLLCATKLYVKRIHYRLYKDFYRPQRSCGKVMFLHLSVILSTGGCLPQCMLGYTPPADGYCSGRYASYWNAFLCISNVIAAPMRNLREGYVLSSVCPWKEGSPRCDHTFTYSNLFT